MTGSIRIAAPLRLWALVCLAAVCSLPAAARAAAPRIGHVFLIVLENQPYHATFDRRSQAPYLAHTLPRQGALLTQYYGIGHYSLDNYIAMISGQAPNADTQQDCPIYRDFVAEGAVDADGQLPGRGCVYPASVPTIADRLEAKGLGWKGYMEDMGKDPQRESSTCGHAAIGAPDNTERATAKDQYAAKHDPFVYFHSIIDNAERCGSHVVNLDALPADLAQVATTPSFAFITPNLCHDGHDAQCASGKRGGLPAVDAFLRHWVPRILASPAYRKDGLLVITFDEGLTGEACCGEKGLPGGRVGAVLLSPFIRPGTVSHAPYNHYSLLRSIAGYFGVEAPGFAGAAGLEPFGDDVFGGHR